MAFTSCTVTHNYENADGTYASGAITFTLTEAITNGTTTIVPASITANLSSQGALSQSLTSNVDTGTLPQTSQWRVDVNILGSVAQSFFVVVPTNTSTSDLYSLMPGSQQVG